MKQESFEKDRALWHLEPADAARVHQIARGTGLSEITARVLVARGIDTMEAAEAFFSPNFARDWFNPALLPNLAAAVDVIEHSIRTNERVAVFGDFDLDGISATALLTRALRDLGGEAHPFVPLRFEEGYGLSMAAMERVLAVDPKLIVTVDSGVSSGDEVAWLLQRGVKVVVTDHHEPSDLVPKDVPVVDPKLDPACPSQSLAGAGVALKIVQALGSRFGKPDLWREYTDLATLGTIADLMPLLGENRVLVADGVERLRTSPRAGIVALCSISGTTPDKLTSDGISFSLSPRLNAAGRMGDPAAALDLLLTDDLAQAEVFALELDGCNRKRQQLEADLAEAAAALAQRTWKGGRVLVVGDEGWHEGVKGIVASRLVNRFGVPALLFSISDGVAHGSGRSVGSVDLFAAVESLSDMLVRFGGHKAAVGVTLAAEDLPRFTQRLEAYFDTLPAEQFVTSLSVDAQVKLDDLSLELLAELDSLRPFGQGNRNPLFVSECIFMNGRRRVGRSEDHLKFSAYDGIAEVPAIAFRCNDIERMAENDAPVDVVFEPTADEWRGRKRLQLIARAIAPCPIPACSPAAELVDDLFERADEYLAREEYAGIVDEPYFNTKLAGVTFEGRQEHIAQLAPGTPLKLVRDRENTYDPNACAVYSPNGAQVGFLNRRLAAVLAPAIDAGVEYDVELTSVTGGEDGKSFGVNVMLSRRDMLVDDETEEVARAARLELSGLDPDVLDAELTRRFIGEQQMHDAQKRALLLLAQGHSVLTVMATGRGKSLIFHLHAARTALLHDGASVFVYPLRALVADQAFHLTQTFAELGLVVRTVTGETSQTDRDSAFAALADGTLDVVLTTPEFLHFHAHRFASSGKVRFMVVDEAHHVGMSRAGHRPAYAALGGAREALGNPPVLAVTATADEATAQTIRTTLGIDEVVLDPTTRDNLSLEDRRNLRDKEGYLVALMARGEKSIVYVNSREQSVKLAKMLRKRVPAIGQRIAFYNGGLSRSVRNLVESAFRDGDISVIIATSAFGEGVNIPDVRNVVLYHQPFNSVEFNQMSGRAGRDGHPAVVHLVFGLGDARINEMILSSSAPKRPDMIVLYRTLRLLQDTEGPGFEITNAEIAERATRLDGSFSLDDRGVSSGLSVFRELGLVSGEGHGAYRKLTVVPTEQKVDLESSVRYLEGLDEIAQFSEFKEWVFDSTSQVLLERFNRPILPIPSGKLDVE